MNRHCGTPRRFTPRRILCSLCLYSSALVAAEGLQPGQESLRLQQQQQRELQRLQLEQRRGSCSAVVRRLRRQPRRYPGKPPRTSTAGPCKGCVWPG